jgi:glutamyl-tRNA synthetase
MRNPAPAFEDAIAGPMESGLASDDFIVRRSDGLFAYQLAVTVDDAAMGITEVVRGDDLLLSTPLQLALFEALGLRAPTYAHLPLVLGSDGARLSKRHAATSIAEYRDAGWSPERVIAMIATSFGLRGVGAAISTHDLIPVFAGADLQPGPWVAPEPFS